MAHTAPNHLGPQEAARERQRDLDQSVRLARQDLSVSWTGYPLVPWSIVLPVVRRHFARIQRERCREWPLEGQDDAKQRNGTNTITEAARTLSNCAHSKRRDRTAATTEQLKSELARAKA